MKKLIFLLFIVFTVTSCIKQNENQSEKIEMVIKNETRTFYKKDFPAWSANFVQNDKVHWVCVEPDAMLRATGWEDLSQFVGGWMKENPEPIDYEKANFQIKNLKMEIMDEMAFVKFEYSNEASAVKKSIESRVLVMENDQWKILSMTSYPSDNPSGSTKNIYIYNSKK